MAAFIWGEGAFENQQKPGILLPQYQRSKKLTHKEQLEYQAELLKRELIKISQDIETKKSIKSVISEVLDHFNLIFPAYQLNGKTPVPFKMEQAS